MELLHGTSASHGLSIKVRGLVEPFEGRGVCLNARDDREHAEWACRVACARSGRLRALGHAGRYRFSSDATVAGRAGRVPELL